MKLNRRPIVLIHGLWNSAEIFNSLTKKLIENQIDFFAPTLSHKLGMTSIVDLTEKINQLILQKYGPDKEIDILGFSMGGIVGRYWIMKFDKNKRTKKFITIGSPHKGTFTAQLIPRFPFEGISEMKINSPLLRKLAKNNDTLNNIQCVSFFTIWDLMVFPGWKAHLPFGKKIKLNIFKHRNLVKESMAIKKIIEIILS